MSGSNKVKECQQNIHMEEMNIFEQCEQNGTQYSKTLFDAMI